VARVDAPRLGDVGITFFSQPTMDTSQLGRFIGRLEMQMSLSQADVETSADAISISFSNSGTSSPLRVQISCKQLDWQLSCMAQVCDQFSPFLFRVSNLGIDTAQSSSASGQDDIGGELWPELISAFGGAEVFRVAGVHVPDILCALHPADGGHTTGTTALPALRNLCVEKPMEMHGPPWDAVQSFITLRMLSNRPVELTVPSYQCHICNIRLQELKTHLVSMHTYRILCSYCGDFVCESAQTHRFPEHLRSKHPEVACNDALISGPVIYASELRQLVDRHSYVRAPDIVAFTRRRTPGS